MSILDFFRKPQAEPQQAAASAPPPPQAMAGESQTFTSLTDPALLEFMREGSETQSGAYVSATKALRNMAVLRSVRLISESIGMLPLKVYEEGDAKTHVKDHPVAKLLASKPNDWQTPYEFKTLMQLRALIYGDAYARVVWMGNKPIRIVPMDPHSTEAILNDNWTMTYRYTKPTGGTVDLTPREVFHLRDLSLDGVNGMSRVKLASEAIGLALQAETAAARLFKNGMMVGGALSHPQQMSSEAYERLQTSMAERYSGATNSHKWMVLEEGMTATTFAQTGRDSQHLENRNHQIEEVARCFGIPRPLLMMDDTSWGSGTEQLGIFFIQYALSPWFTAWEQAIERTLFIAAEAGRYYTKFNEHALMRGTLKDQADYFSKALGAGGHSPWMTPNEVRGTAELPKSTEKNADSLVNPMTQKATQPATKKENGNEPDQTA